MEVNTLSEPKLSLWKAKLGYPSFRGGWLGFLVWYSAVLGGGPASVLSAAESGPSFSRDIRPILSDRCFQCHGPDEKKRKGGLRLDVRDEALREMKSGHRAIVSGKPDLSELVKRIDSHDPDELMPPPSIKKPLTDSQREVLKKWVLTGAVYEDHWAFKRPVTPAVPEVRDRASVRNPIDAFVIARLEQEGMKLSSEADRATLARRVALDLTGLPPTEEELETFLADGSDRAYEAWVDRLLASPHYGERWARKWLDLARYADTNGYEKDRQRSIWPYRDWVIHALNADKPFDQFTVEQLAGDMIPEATRDQLIATGFHRNTMLNEEGGIDPLEFRFMAMTDRVATTGAAWLGLTLQCAQCHTHKYDPIPHQEYYRVMAFLNNADEPDLDLPPPDYQAKVAERNVQADRLLAGLAEQWPVVESEWAVAKPLASRSEQGATTRVMEDHSVLFGGNAAAEDVYTLEWDNEWTGVDRIRLEVLTDGSLPNKGPGRAPNGNFVLTDIKVMVAAMGGAPVELKVASGTAEVEQSEFSVGKAFDADPKTGWAVHVPGKPLNENRSATFHLDSSAVEKLRMEGSKRWTVRLAQNYGGQHLMGRIKVSLGRAVSDGKPIAERRKELVGKSFETWLAREKKRTVIWRSMRPMEAKANLPLLTVQKDDSVFASGDTTKHDTYELRFEGVPAGVTGFRIEALPDDRLPAHGPGMTFYEGPKGDFFLSELDLTRDGAALKLAKASQSYSRNGIGSDNVTADKAIDGDLQTGWSASGRAGERHTAVFKLAQPLAAPGEIRVKMQFWRHFAASLGRFRISYTTSDAELEARDLPEDVENLLAQDEGTWSPAEKRVVFDQFLLNAPELQSEARKIRELRKPPSVPTTLVMRERPPENPRITTLHHRGEFLQPKERVEPGVLTILNPFPKELPNNRLGFAKWLVSPENPLTARVVMNRHWAALFGAGLVKTVEDFGYQGELPSHPDLLDWLATEFVRRNGSMKSMHKLMVMSATYRQDSRVTEAALARDPQNRLLSHASRRRLEAEYVRDAALRASGLLTETIGGPSVFPPQPPSVSSDGTYGAMSWTASTGPDRYRRGLYVFAKRTAPFALFNTFDAPSGEACVARRESSNTPLQALSLMNDQVFVEAAQAFGAMLASKQGDDSRRLEILFKRALSRKPTDFERQRFLRFIEAQRDRLHRGELKAQEVAGSTTLVAGNDLREYAVWALAARAVFNLDEFITKG